MMTSLERTIGTLSIGGGDGGVHFISPIEKYKPMEVLTMGTCSDFNCKCGYEAFGKWGIGMNPIYREQKICLAPALCKDCRELVNVNENAVLPKCPECNGLNVVLYDDPSLGQVRRKSVAKVNLVKKGTESSDKSEIEDFIEGVDTTIYLCPKCNRFTLEKTGGGLFD